MNEIVIDKRIFMQIKKRSNTKTIFPEIKYPPNLNMNGSSILKKIQQEIMVPKDHVSRQKSYQVPLSNILISKRITPINPEQSPHLKRKNNNNKDDSARRFVFDQRTPEETQRKTSTSLSQRPTQKQKYQHERVVINGINRLGDEIKNINRNAKNQQLTVFIGKANNNEDLVREILAERKIWREIKSGEGIPHLKWVFSKQRHNYKKMWSFTQTRAINHFQFNEQLTTKDNLIRNLQVFCETRKMQVFNLTPVTFIIDFDDQYCQYNMRQFLSFYSKNDPRKNNQKKPSNSSHVFINKFQAYMAWQNSDIKKKVNILSRPVNSSTYYSNSQQPGYIWLLKPTGLNRGRGIQIFDNLESLEKMLMDFLVLMNRKNFREVREGKDGAKQRKKNTKSQVKVTQKIDSKISNNASEIKEHNQQQKVENQQQQKQQKQETKFCKQNFKLSTCSFVIQKYVQRPFLIQKRKFDIRVWVLLTQTIDLYFFKQGYIRTSAQQYQIKDIDNYFIHLTNNAIQKNSQNYGQFQNGNQLSFRDLGGIIGTEQTQKIWQKMKEVTYMAFSSVNKKINQNQRKFCFQLFGLDFIIDEQLKVWLIEINQNPCIECASPLLSKLIPRMINDAFKLTIDQIFSEKRPNEKVYNVAGYANGQNMWQMLGHLGPNAEYSPKKQAGVKGSGISQSQKPESSRDDNK